MQCFSPSNGERCKNNKLGDSLFCYEHQHFLKLYHKYKKIEGSICNYLGNNKFDYPLEELFKIYSRLYDSYKMRIKYREIAFVKEAWDKGHDIRINIIWNLIEKCYQAILRKHDENDIEKNKNNRIITNENNGNNENNEKIIHDFEKIRKRHRKIYNREKSWNKAIPEFIKKANEERQKFYEMFKSYFKEINEKYSYIDDEKFLFWMHHFLMFIFQLGEEPACFKRRFYIYEYDDKIINNLDLLNYCNHCFNITKNFFNYSEYDNQIVLHFWNIYKKTIGKKFVDILYVYIDCNSTYCKIIDIGIIFYINMCEIHKYQKNQKNQKNWKWIPTLNYKQSELKCFNCLIAPPVSNDKIEKVLKEGCYYFWSYGEKEYIYIR